jgi:drug/metabolite transporter (DMT)-like permease
MTGTNKNNASPLMVVLAFTTVYIVWGSTYFFIQRAIHGFPPLLMGAMRFLIAGALLMGWCMIKGEKLFIWKNVKPAAISGLLLLFVGNGIVIWVEQFLPSAMVAIMVSSSPIWFVLLDKPKWKENFNSKPILMGLMIGFVGVIVLFGEKIMSTFSTIGNKTELGALGLLVIGPIAWAGGSLYSKYKSTGGSAPVNTAWQMLVAGLAFIPGSLLRGEVQHLQWQQIPASAWFSLLYLVFFGSIAAFSAYVWLLQVRSAIQVSTYAYVNPVVAVLLGIFLANEHISWLQVLGLVTILGSVLLINLAKYRKEKTAVQKENTGSSQMQVKTYKQLVKPGAEV